jgi:nucleoside-diphosphate-sugar epimerase
MRVLIIGCGLVGTELAKLLVADGHHVIGTTTTPTKVELIARVCSEARVLRGNDVEKVHEAARGCDAIVVCAGPAAQQAMTPEQRRATYHRVLVETAESAATAPISGPVIALSSLSVYGNAGAHLSVIDEDSPLTTRDDASPMCFQAAERTYLSRAQGRACIFRLSDVMGGDDLPIEDKIKMANQLLGGSVPFHDDALFYRVHVIDVARAIKHAIDHKLTGIYNLTHAEVPPTNKQFFDAISAAIGVPNLSFRNELEAPTHPVSTERIRATGFTLLHSPSERMPAPGEKARSVTAGKAAPRPAIDRRGRQVVLDVLEQLRQRFALEEVLGADGGAYLPLIAQGGPLQGTSLGAFRVHRGGPIHKLVYSALSSDELGLDTHQIYAFTAPDSALPHFFVDVAYSPNTDSTFHLGIDLVPRVDLSSMLAYSREVFAPLTLTLEGAFETAGVAQAKTIGPLARSLRSPWMLAAYVQPTAVGQLSVLIQAYLAQWLKVVEGGLSTEACASVAKEDLAARDLRNRAAMFSAETNRVWVLLDRLLGEKTGVSMREILISPN